MAAGNAIVGGGFRPSQGGFECGLRDPLDGEIVRSFAGEDTRFVFDAAADELSCRHCWATVYGGVAALRYQREHEEARRDTRYVPTCAPGRRL